MQSKQVVKLVLPLTMDMLPVAVSAMENAVAAFGLGKAECLSISLAIEEIFVFMATEGRADEQVEFSCYNGGYYAEVRCVCPRRVLPSKVFNMTASVSLDDESSLRSMGLLLAARTVDTFRLVSVSDDRLGVYMTVDKRYPAAEVSSLAVLPANGFALIEPGTEEIKEFAKRLTAGCCTAPAFCRFPGKLVDMIRSGEYSLVLAGDRQREVGGGFLWRYANKMAECYGPYVFTDQPELAVLLLDEAISRLARSGMTAMTIRQATAALPPGYFESLGEGAWYRQMEEDNGMTVFVHPDVIDFVQERYQSLALPRQLRVVQYDGEQRPPESAFSTELDRLRQVARLRTLVAGADAAANLQQHISALRQEGIRTIFFELDLSDVAAVQQIPAILAAGFCPQLILPWGGIADLMVLVCGEEA